jgi:hypothetical protein
MNYGFWHGFWGYDTASSHFSARKGENPELWVLRKPIVGVKIGRRHESDSKKGPIAYKNQNSTFTA